MSSTNRYQKAAEWLKEPDKHIHSILVDEDMVSAVVVGDTGEWVVGFGKDRDICGCPHNRITGTSCSHLIFARAYLVSMGLLAKTADISRQ